MWTHVGNSGGCELGNDDLWYRYVRDTASLGMRLEPPIEQLTTFTGIPLHFELSQPYFERIAAEVH